MAVLSIDVGIKNLSYCMYEHETRTIKAWEVFCVTDSKFGSDMPHLVAAALNQRWDTFKDAQQVVIEQQPGSNKRMKVMEAYIHMYFVMRDKPAVLYHARHKLENMEGGAPKGKQNYYHRKKASVKETLEFLDKHPQAPEIAKVYTSAKKKDDVADCFLQAVAYCSNPHGVVQAHAARQKKLKDDSNVRPRRPTSIQADKGRYTKPVIKHLINELRKEKGVMVLIDDPDPVAAEKARLVVQVSADKTLAKNVKRFYPTPEACLAALYPEFRENPKKEMQSDGT